MAKISASFLLILISCLIFVQSANVKPRGRSNKLPAKLEQEPETETPSTIQVTEEIPNDDIEEDETVTEEIVEGSTDNSEEDLEAVERKSETEDSKSFFGINFGKTNGGTISISNSYSTGSHGVASSEAKAFSSNPESDDEE